MTITYDLLSFDDARELPGFPMAAVTDENYDYGDDDQLSWWVETNAGSDTYWGEHTYALVELIDGKFNRCVQVDQQPDPEDATLARSYSWVIDELNKLGARL